MEKLTKTALYKAHTAKKTPLLIVILMGFLFIFSINLVSAVDWENCVAYYKLDGSSGAVVDSTTLYPGTNYGADRGIAGKINDAFDFDSVAEDYVDVGTGFNYEQNFTINLWLNLGADLASTRYIIGPNTGGGFALGISGTEYLRFSDTVANYVDSTVALPTGEWKMVTLVFNGTHSNFYINGSAAGKIPFAHSMALGKTYYLGRSSGADYVDGKIDEFGFWNVTLTDAEISELYNDGAGLTYQGMPSVDIELISPLDDITVSDVGVNFTAYYNVSLSYNLTNATYYLWNSTGVFNNSVFKEITGRNNLTNEYIDDFRLGTYDWNVYFCYGNATFSNCSFANENYSFFVGASILNESWNNETYETKSETFETNVSLLAGTTFYDAKLRYNGSLYDALINEIGTDTYSITSTIDIPLTNTALVEYDWNWELIYQVGTNFIYQNLSNHTGNASQINLSSCGGDVLSETLNFSVWNEETLAIMSSFNFYGTFEYWLGSGDIRKNKSLTSIGVNEKLICINPNLTYYSDAKIKYEKAGFVTRNYYLNNATLTNASQKIEMFFLNESSSTSFIIEVIDSVQQEIPDAYIYIQKYFPGLGVFKTIEIVKTDADGSTIAHFEVETEDYKFLIIKDGTLLLETEMQKIFCRETPCTLQFQIGDVAPATWTNYGDLPNLIWSLEYDVDLETWTYTYVDTSGTTNYGRLMVYTQDGLTKSIICNITDSSSAATLSCNVSGIDGTTFAEAYISRSPELLLSLKDAIHKTLKIIVGLPGLFWAMIILMVLGFIGLTMGTPIGIIMVCAGLVLINVIGLASFGMTTIMGLIIMGLLLLWELKR